MEEEGANEELLKACSLTTTGASSPLRWSHFHHRSHSDSHTLSSSQGHRRRTSSRGSASGNGRRRGLPPISADGASSSSLGPTFYSRWRKDSATESTTSGVSSSDSMTMTMTMTTQAQIQQQIVGHTLSPIPSSASIATTGDPQSPPSRGE